MHYLLSTWFLSLALSSVALANDFAANELLEMLNQDPSLLLDPDNKIENPPPVLPPPEAEREIQSEEVQSEQSEKSKDEAAEVAKTEEGQTEESKSQKPNPDENKPVEAKAEEQIKVEEADELAKGGEEKTKEIESVEEVKPEPPTVAVTEIPPEPQSPPELTTPPVTSQLVALPGVNDFSIILSEKEFFPAMIRMKQSEKARLLFISTSAKPGALVFTKPQIQRWLDRDPTSAGLDIKKEINAAKVTQIEFSAEPGVYKFYDALSGATGEIQVE